MEICVSSIADGPGLLLAEDGWFYEDFHAGGSGVAAFFVDRLSSLPLKSLKNG